jgi:metal-responsive CopG/Arc/MetJ family transcriptional regulator
METIQVVLDKKLLQATDKAARHMKRNRSALVREALREYLRRLETRALEEQDRQGYAKHPEPAGEWGRWEPEAAWPEE